MCAHPSRNEVIELGAAVAPTAFSPPPHKPSRGAIATRVSVGSRALERGWVNLIKNHFGEFKEKLMLRASPPSSPHPPLIDKVTLHLRISDERAATRCAREVSHKNRMEARRAHWVSRFSLSCTLPPDSFGVDTGTRHTHTHKHIHKKRVASIFPY